MAARRLTRDVVGIAGVGVADAVTQGDVARGGESRRRRRRPILELPVRMERSEVYRDVGPKVIDDPSIAYSMKMTGSL